MVDRLAMAQRWRNNMAWRYYAYTPFSTKKGLFMNKTVLLISFVALMPIYSYADGSGPDQYTAEAQKYRDNAEELKKEAEAISPDKEEHHELKAAEHRERAKEEEFMAEHHDKAASEAEAKSAQ